ncbi:MAG TPA: hypothetical protein VEQ85_14380 [Lacipirellulaceae bacterium]|nr:hypothetical protein [Lacipirellulaceae bacterium]
MVLAVNDGSGPVSVRISIVPAPELPDRQSDASGLFARREDNSLFVGTGNIEVGVEVDGATGERTFSATSSGPEVEVVVTGDTVIYRDDAEISPGESAGRKNGERTIHRCSSRMARSRRSARIRSSRFGASDAAIGSWPRCWCIG